MLDFFSAGGPPGGGAFRPGGGLPESPGGGVFC